MESETIIDGQGKGLDVSNVDTGEANDILGNMQKKSSRSSATDAAMSARVKRMIESPDFRHDDGMYTTNEIIKRRNLKAPEGAFGAEYFGQIERPEEFMTGTSNTSTIIKDSIRQFGMQLATLDDKAAIALGGLTSKITGGEWGSELRDRAYYALESATADMSFVNTNPADAETWTARLTMGASSMLEMMAVSMMTGGKGPLVQMGIEVFGDGTYNNMIDYAKNNNGSIEGYEGNWSEIGIDIANAGLQVLIEKKLGLGRNFLRGTGGHLIKEGINGFAQESSQEFLNDFGEYTKGNIDRQQLLANWENWVISGVIGGVLQGPLGASTYKGSRLKADAIATQVYKDVAIMKNPNVALDMDTLHKQARKFATEFNDKTESGIATDMYQELVDRFDVKNDRGRLRDSFAVEVGKAWEAAKGEPLTEKDYADVQDWASIASAESFRMSMIEGIPIEDTIVGRIYADGNKLKLREYSYLDEGVIEKKASELGVDKQELVNSIADQRVRMTKHEVVMNNMLKDMQMSRDASQAKPMTKEERIAARKSKVKKAIRRTSSASLATKIRESGYITPGAAEEIGLDPSALNQDKKSFQKLVRENGKIKRGDSVVEMLSDMGYQVYDEDGSIDWDAVHDITQKGDISNLRSIEYEAQKKDYSEQKAERQALMEEGEVSTQIEDEEYIPFQQGIKGEENRGAYDPKYQEIILNKDADISTIIHEFSHQWLNSYFKMFRSENAPEGFRQWWGKVENELGIKPYDQFLDRDISEKFARSFEKYVRDGGEGAPKSLQPAFERLSEKMAQVYDDVATEYFDQTLSAETDAWFAMNEKLAESILTREGMQEVSRAEERSEAIKEVQTEARIEKGELEAAKVISEEFENNNDGTDQSYNEYYDKSYDTDEIYERKLAKRLGGEKEFYAREDQAQMQKDAEKRVYGGEVDFALAVISGKESGGSIRDGAWFNALVNFANDTSNPHLMDRIKATGFISEGTEKGREVAALRNYTRQDGGFDGFNAVNAVDVNYDQLTIKNKKAYNAEMKALEDKILEADKSLNFDNFFEDWICK